MKQNAFSPSEHEGRVIGPKRSEVAFIQIKTGQLLVGRRLPQQPSVVK